VLVPGSTFIFDIMEACLKDDIYICNLRVYFLKASIQEALQSLAGRGPHGDHLFGKCLLLRLPSLCFVHLVGLLRSVWRMLCRRCWLLHADALPHWSCCLVDALPPCPWARADALPLVLVAPCGCFTALVVLLRWMLCHHDAWADAWPP
jgi:hypothetical protein